MSEKPKVTEMGLAQARLDFSRIINRSAFGGERIIVTSHGRPKAAIIPIEDLHRLLELDFRTENRAASPA